MLEHREQWKMELLRPYAHIRLLLRELGRRSGLNSDIHWLRLSEIEQLKLDGQAKENTLLVSSQPAELRKKITERKERFEIFKNFNFPDVIDLKEIEDIVQGKPPEHLLAYDGEALSSGLAEGEVRVVTDPNQVDFSDWPEGVILVAEATDPGWTPLFIRARAIVVARGGVLSHCAIVAREMGIPAVSGVRDAHRTFKDGERLWVDGNNGRVLRA